MTETDDNGPWAVYDGYCMKCSTRAIHVVPVSAEDVPLWECGSCGAMAVSYRLHEDDNADVA